jgi:hypothetical protein
LNRLIINFRKGIPVQVIFGEAKNMNQESRTKLENAIIFAKLLTLMGVVILIIAFMLPAKAMI